MNIVDKEDFENQLNKIKTCDIIELLNQLIIFIKNVYNYKNYSEKQSLSTLIAKIGFDNDLQLTNNKIKALLDLNIDYNLLQSNLIGFSPINSNMWKHIDDESIIAIIESGSNYKGIYNDLTKYSINDYVKYKDEYYQLKSDSNTGLFNFYTVIENVINSGLSDGSNLYKLIYLDDEEQVNGYLNNFLLDIPNEDVEIKSLVIGFIERLEYLLTKNDSNGVTHKLPRCYDFIVKKLTQDFNYYRFYELQEDDKFDLSEKLREFSTNPIWKENDDLWSLVAAACNDIGAEFYSKIKKYISNISDLETCNLRSLKSIAKSVGYNSNILNISNNFTIPVELERLIDLFSINRKILFDKQHGILSESSVSDIIGLIDSDRSIKSPPLFVDEKTKQIQNRIPYNVIHKIKTNINKILYVVNNNFQQIELYGYQALNNNYWIDDVDEDEISNIETIAEWKNTSTYSKDAIIYVIVNKQKYYFKSVKDNNKNHHPITHIDLINKIKSIEFKNLAGYQIIKENETNYFAELIKFIQQNVIIYNSIENNWQIMDVVYINEKTGAQENLLQLFIMIIQSIKQYDLNYRYQFVMFHIFGLFYSKIFNYELDPSYDHPTQSVTEYTIEEFKKMSSEYIGQSDLDDYFTNNNIISINDKIKNTQHLIQNLTQNNLDFIKYITFLYKSLNIKEQGEEDQDQFSSEVYTHYYLLNKNTQLKLIERMIKMSSYLTDYCIKVSYERELIKKQVKIYALAGTNQIIEDVLADYFIANFSRDDDNIFNGELNSKLTSKEELTKSISPFTIELVEYQDNTNYFNIEADLPQVLTGQKIVGYEKYIHESINNRGELVQEQREKPIYENVYSNQVIPDANSQYWDSITTLSNDSSNIESYKNYYNKWLNVDQDIDTYLLETVPFIEHLYSTFNPSGTNDVELDSLLKFNSENKINSNIRNHKNKTFPSIATLQFLPNLVEVSNVYKDDSLVLSKAIYDSSVQYLNAILTDILKNSDYNRDDYYSIIKNGWKTDLVEFNGYTTYYEDSNNKDSLDLYSDHRIDVDGPWVYSSLQQFLYMYYNQLLSCLKDENGNIKTHNDNNYNYINYHNDCIDQFITREFVYDKQLITNEVKTRIRNLYKDYLFDYSQINNLTTKTAGENGLSRYDTQIKNIFTNLSKITNIDNTLRNNNENTVPFSINGQSDYTKGCLLNVIKKCSIHQFEKDMYDNQYTLFKLNTNNEFEDVGQIWIRMYNHPLSVPLKAFLEYSNNAENNNIQDIVKLADNCMYFKCFENTMLIMGYDQSSIKCVIFNFTTNLESMQFNIDLKSINYVSNDNSGKLPHINGFVGSYVDLDNIIHILLYDYSLVNNQNDQNIIHIYDHQYNINKGYVDTIKLINEVNDGITLQEKPVIKDFLQNNSKITPLICKKYALGIYSSEQSWTYYHIWSVNFNKHRNELYIGFEFLNKNFIVGSNADITINDSYNGYQKKIFNCPVLEYKVYFDTETINSQIDGNIAKKIDVRLYNEQFELFYKDNIESDESHILSDSIIQLKNNYIQQKRNTLLNEDVIVTPMWMLLNDVNVDVVNKNITNITEAEYIYNNYLQVPTSFDATKNTNLYTKLINYFNTFDLLNVLAQNIKIKLANYEENNKNLFIETLQLIESYEIIDTTTYNNCIAVFSDCMNCMNQTGLFKFNFTDNFEISQNLNNVTKSILEQKNQQQIIDELDMDISVRLKDSQNNYLQNVGWKCNNIQSSVLNWISSDNVSGGPEIVSFNLKSKINNENLKTSFPISAHWYNEQASSTISSLEIFYKGYYNKSQYIVLPFDNGCSINHIADIEIEYKKTTNNRIILDNVDVNIKDIYYGLLINWNIEPNSTNSDEKIVVDSLKIIYSSNEKFNNNYISGKEEFIYIGVINQSNIITQYINNIQQPSTVELKGDENSSIKYIGRYYYVSNNIWRCPNAVSADNISYYQLKYDNNTKIWSLSSKGSTEINIPISNQKLVKVVYNKDITIRQYIFDLIYSSNIKVKLFEYLNKKILIGDLQNYNVYNVNKYELFDNSNVDSDDYYVTLYDFVNISNYSQFNRLIIKSISF